MVLHADRHFTVLLVSVFNTYPVYVFPTLYNNYKSKANTDTIEYRPIWALMVFAQLRLAPVQIVSLVGMDQGVILHPHCSRTLILVRLRSKWCFIPCL